MRFAKLTELCQRYDVISFDIFDTLLKRDVLHPSDVFELAELSLVRKYGEQFTGFAQRRRIAGREARKKSRYDEVTFDEIYCEMCCSNEDKLLMQGVELEIERKILHVNQRMKKLYDVCQGNTKTIYIVSDMYLPKGFLEGILHSEGYSGYQGFYLSCEYRQTKKSGKLFDTLCKSEGISPDRILHIGDSWYADCVGPLRSGVRFAHIERTERNTIYYKLSRDADRLDQKCLFSFLNNRESNLKDRAERVGYEVLGPIIYGYCRWLHEKTCDSDARVWFAARDMFLFDRAYRMMYGAISDVSYVYLSRKSLRPAYTDAVGDLAKSGDAFPRGKYSITQIINYMGYSLADVNLEDGLDIDAPIYDARKLSENEEIGRILDSTAIAERESLLCETALAYLRDQGLFANDIFFVDVGWHGTTQHLLRKIQEKWANGYHVEGYYLGCLDSTNDKIGRDSYQAYLFDENSQCMFMKGIILFECLILPPHGTTICYENKGGKVKPVLGKEEQISQLVLNIQKGAMRFVEDICHSGLDDLILFQADTVKTAFERLTSVPENEEVNSIGDLYYENYRLSRVAAPQSLIHYLLHMREFFIDFKYSPWRIGFLYRLFKVRLPYARIYTTLRKLSGKIT